MFDLFGNEESRHDRAVRETAKRLEASPVFEDVEADHIGGDQPRERDGVIPDIEADRVEGGTALFEVDAGSPTDHDQRQDAELRGIAASRNDLTYERLEADDILRF